jgi:hypothetical protein
MSEINFKDAEGLQALVSEEFGPWSSTVKVTQDMINQFAELTGDHMWLHVDVERCAEQSPFKSTIAHGFLILSLIPKMKQESPLAAVTGFGHIMNYGSDKLRFLGAVPVDSEIHSRARVKSVEVAEHKTVVIMEQHVHVVGSDKPALIYELMFVYM